MEHPGRNLTDPAFGRVTDFYSVGCRFESCWDRQPFLAFLISNDKMPLSVPLLRTPVRVGHIHSIFHYVFDAVRDHCSGTPPALRWRLARPHPPPLS
jgi:hypothetical protein